MLCAKKSGLARGQTLQFVRRSDTLIQMILKGDQHFLAVFFSIENGFGQCRYAENGMFCSNNREICDNIYQ